MTPKEAVKALDSLAGDHEMEDHMRADQILIELLRSFGQDQVAETWERTRDRIGLWYK
jgi:hypothetical protein